MKTQNIFGVQLIFFSLLSPFARGMCDQYENCENCADQRVGDPKCVWCESESEQKPKCQRYSVPCLGEKINWKANCKEYCDISPCKSCVQQEHCNWCISDSTCRTEMQDGKCEFGIVDKKEFEYYVNLDTMCYLANGFPRADKKDARGEWQKINQRRKKKLNDVVVAKTHDRYVFHERWAMWGAIGVAVGFVVCITGILFFYCCYKKRNGDKMQTDVTEVEEVIQEAVRQRSNDFVPPVIPNHFQQKHSRPKTGNTKKDGVRIHLSPVVGSDDERFTGEVMQNETPMMKRFSEGMPEGQKK